MADKLALSVTETAELLGVSRPSVYALLKREVDPLPSFTVGTRRLIPMAALRAWLEKQTHE